MQDTFWKAVILSRFLSNTSLKLNTVMKIYCINNGESITGSIRLQKKNKKKQQKQQQQKQQQKQNKIMLEVNQ